MSLQLGETFFDCKIQRPVQWVPRTENSLLLKHNELAKIFLSSPPPPPPFLTACYGPAKAKNMIHYSSLYLFSGMTEVYFNPMTATN